MRNYPNLKVNPILPNVLDNPNQELGPQNNPLKSPPEMYFLIIMTNMKKNSKESKFPNLIFGEAGKLYLKKQNSGKEKKAGCIRELNITRKIISGKPGF